MLSQFQSCLLITLVEMSLCRVKTGYGVKCLKYKIPKLWNKLHTDLKEQSSLNMYRNNNF